MSSADNNINVSSSSEPSSEPHISWSKHQIFENAADINTFNTLRARAMRAASNTNSAKTSWSRIQQQLYTYKTTHRWEYAATYQRLYQNHFFQTPINPAQRKRQRSAATTKQINAAAENVTESAVVATPANDMTPTILNVLTGLRRDVDSMLEHFRVSTADRQVREQSLTVATTVAAEDDGDAYQVDLDDVMRSPPHSPMQPERGITSVPVYAMHVGSVEELFGHATTVTSSLGGDSVIPVSSDIAPSQASVASSTLAPSPSPPFNLSESSTSSDSVVIELHKTNTIVSKTKLITAGRVGPIPPDVQPHIPDDFDGELLGIPANGDCALLAVAVATGDIDLPIIVAAGNNVHDDKAWKSINSKGKEYRQKWHTQLQLWSDSKVINTIPADLRVILFKEELKHTSTRTKLSYLLSKNQYLHAAHFYVAAECHDISIIVFFADLISGSLWPRFIFRDERDVIVIVFNTVRKHFEIMRDKQTKQTQFPQSHHLVQRLLKIPPSASLPPEEDRERIALNQFESEVLQATRNTVVVSEPEVRNPRPKRTRKAPRRD